VPAAAVIPAPIAYIKVVAVKKHVVGSRFKRSGPLASGYCCAEQHMSVESARDALNRCVTSDRLVYFEKIRVLKAGRYGPNILAWNNGICR
jgi:hypothetical protein